VARKPCERLSGHGSSPSGEESEALNRAAFDSLGQKRRAFEPLCLSYSNGFFATLPEHFWEATLKERTLGLNPQWPLRLFPKTSILQF